MPAIYAALVQDFVNQSVSEIVGILSVGYAREGFTDQKTDLTEAWAQDIPRLQHSLIQLTNSREFTKTWTVVLEFTIPRKGKRIDVALITPASIVVLELKGGHVSTEAIRQVEEYCLLLHYFHKPSFKRKLLPFVISPVAIPLDISNLRQSNFDFEELPSTWIAPTTISNWESLPEQLGFIASIKPSNVSINAKEWIEGAYFAVPSIIEAALALKDGLSIREIAHSEASEHEVEAVAKQIQDCVTFARTNHEFAICFLTGVPGSGKTLVGLGLAHSKQEDGSAIHFMSGNGPLVKVLLHLFTKQAQRNGVPAPQARAHAQTLIENVHLFAKTYADDPKKKAPQNHVIIFDEAQRAWDRAQNWKSWKRAVSEPEMLFEIMERHEDWAVVIALVGGGQEINDGEAGLEEWGRSLQGRRKPWRVFASPEVLNGGESTAGHRLFEDGAEQASFSPIPELHLRTSNRSLRAEGLAKWVNAVLSGDSKTANALRIGDKFPLLLTRKLNTLKKTLETNSIGDTRYGLVASSGAGRLRAEGLEADRAFHDGYSWEHWYLADRTDIRSSFQCEVFATEFAIQGLELDWIGLCWDGDLIWHPLQGWQKRTLRAGTPSKWNPIKNPEKSRFRENAYRVLLTRARQGMVIFVPQGNATDPTRRPEELDATATFLQECGVKSID